MNNALSDKIKALLDNGATAKELARESGCAVSTIYRLRDGLILDPSYSIGHAIDREYEKLAGSVPA